MSLQSDLIQWLIDLNTDAAGRIFQDQVDQGADRPLIATTEINGNRPSTLDGRGLLNRSTIRISIFAKKAEQTESIATQIRIGLNNYRGYMGSTRLSSVRVETSSDEVALSDGDNIVKGKGLDLFFLYY